MRPLVEATVADASGSMKATFFNQPWLVQRYPAGTRLVLHGKLPGPQPVLASRPRPHHRGRRRRRRRGRALPGHRRAVLDPDPGAGARARRRARGRARAAAGAAARRASGCPTAPTRWARRTSRRRRPTPTTRPPPAGVRRAAARPAGAAAPARLRRDAAPRAGARRRARADRPLAGGDAAVRADRRPASGRSTAIDARSARRPRPMQRLLMGEVGSGKTVVALYALLRAVEHGYQGALMAPTETLAEQHFATIQSLMPGEAVRAGLLTGSTPGARRADLLGKLATGELSLIVGTHALIEDAVRFARLGVAVVDEQHRFGVRQRAALDAKGADRRPPARAAHDRDADPADAGAARLRRPRLHACCASCRAAASRCRRSCARPSASGRAPTSGSARSCAPGARRSSSARWSRSPRCSRPAPPRPSSSGCATGSCATSGWC